ncbi:hypothetical protein RFI_35130 [Reticulomyxa filosa]|uniref:Viral A-type inclusion protein n=1 Tax=Reticulomyxa filosa TaxID=46433 RepID=X6LNL3_RETFI|nr:hypothetical protein RFI_35130 [Reticulomyxa filosa]|eukprot:ETO02305.1 hypothetical protein RFI_35130 [Reticulomyxa filosa]
MDDIKSRFEKFDRFVLEREMVQKKKGRINEFFLYVLKFLETGHGVEEVFKKIDKGESKDFEYKTDALGKFQTAIDEFKKKKNRLPNATKFLRYWRAAFEDQETEVDTGMYAQLSGVYKDAKELAMQLKHRTDDVLQTKLLDSKTKATLRDLWKWIEEKGLTTLQKSQDNDEELDKLRQQCDVLSQEHASQKTSLETQMKISAELEKQLLNSRIEVEQLKDQLQSFAENQEIFQTIEQQLTPLETDVKQKDQNLNLAQKSWKMCASLQFVL